MTYDPNSNGGFEGLDRLGRVIDQKWVNDSAAVKDRFRYGYDRNSNRIWRENVLTHGTANKFDEYYNYDNLDRLSGYDRGDLAGTDPNFTGISGPATWEEDYTLETLGNWKGYLTKTDGNTVLNQTRSHNPANEITAIDANWILPAYDNTGNMTKGPKAGDP